MSDTKALAIRERTIDRSVMLAEKQLAAAGIPAEMMRRVVLNAMTYGWGLSDCSEESVERAVLMAAQDGLLPDGRDAAFVPFTVNGRKVCTYIPMIQGLTRLAREALPGLALWTRSVYTDDFFEHEEGSAPVLKHRRSPDGARGPEHLKAVYACARVPGSDLAEFVVLYPVDIQRERAKSPSAQKRGSAWNAWPEEMAQKAALKRVLKRLPMRSRQFDALLQADEVREDDGYSPGQSVADAMAAVDVEVQPQPQPKQEPQRAKRQAQPKQQAKARAKSAPPSEAPPEDPPPPEEPPEGLYDV